MTSKILILTNNDGGLYFFRRELIEALKSQHRIAIALPYGPLVEPLKKMGCEFVDTKLDRRSINPIKDIRLLVSYQRIMKRQQPDLVLTYTIKPNIYGGLLCRWLHIPYAVNITGLGTAFQKNGLLNRFVTRLYRSALKDAKVVFFENVENQSVFQKRDIVSKAQSCLLHGAGVNLAHFVLQEYPTDTVPITFLFMGRVMKEKGIEELLAAMQRLVSEGVSCSLDVLGSLEENYADQMQQAEKQGWLHYYGYQNDVRPFIAAAHCFVLPSWHEGMANTNLECAASGRPVITSNIHGCKEAVIDTVSGFLCEKQNAESLYQAMKRFLSLSYMEQKQMGLEGRKHMEKVFDKKNVVEKTIAEIMK